MTDVNERRRKSKPKKPKKPRPDFPLYAHGVGKWAKKVKGKTVYFTKWTDDPKGVAALEMWLEQKDDLLAGREPRKHDPDAFTIVDLCNHYLTHHEERRDRGEISPRTFLCMRTSCGNIIDCFGKTRPVSDLTPDDFGKLRSALAGTRKAVSLRNEMQRCRSVFRYAYVNGLIDREIRYGSKFDRPELKQVRRERWQSKDEHGLRMLDADELRLILDNTKQPLRTMVLLAVNCGFGPTDLSRLPMQYIDLEEGLIDYPRPKTEADRVCPLWPETIEAIQEWIPKRPKPKDRANNDLLFLTVRGAPFLKVAVDGTHKDAAGQEFNKVLNRLGLKRRGIGLYALRHTFRTIADDARDTVAANLIMGHVDNSMAAVYREDVAIDRLRAVTDHVRQWLFPPDEDSKPTDDQVKKSPQAGDLPDDTDDDEPPILKLFAG